MIRRENMEVRGIRKEVVKVDVEPKELVLGLSKVIGVQALFIDVADEYAVLEEKDGKYYIVIKRNECYHGTPHYDEYSRKELTKEEYAAANGLREMMKIIHKAD
jgi:hypothetical protein